jgi:endonuclease/exonuclease/phosphatase family metal-dependent hydrolase
MTFNIRYDTPQDGQNQWKYRKESVGKVIIDSDPDILGTQEVLPNQLKDLQNLLPSYNNIGVPRDGRSGSSEACSIFFKKSRFSLLKSGTF